MLNQRTLLGRSLTESTEIDISSTFNDDVLSRHCLILGGTGTGKTNLFYHIVGNIIVNLNDNDILMIFDTKGDYYKTFANYCKENSLILSNTEKSSNWNIFNELIDYDNPNDSLLIANAYELSKFIFKETIEQSNEPFFAIAASDIFSAILITLCREAIGKKDKRKELTNKKLKNILNVSNGEMLFKLIDVFPDLKSIAYYIADYNGKTARSIISVMYSVVRPLLTTGFAEDGSFSIKNFIKRNYEEKNILFVEYDLNFGNVLTPIYRTVFDLALKEALGRANALNSNVYLIIDEFKLLPYLEHLEDGLNFGRSKGVKIIAGLQSIEQINHLYGESKAKSIISGFSSLVAFRPNDSSTRKFITEYFGTAVVSEQFQSVSRQMTDKVRDANVVEDWDLQNLKLGEAITGICEFEPKKYHFAKCEI
ncbi:MAG: type IV secretion system DNA-binding domain-containing protein [Oscillospiraceae bacterium]|nr:type IV secretion system DNA-binding domain-containing protein [Oscillospiraceae bacterium]